LADHCKHFRLALERRAFLRTILVSPALVSCFPVLQSALALGNSRPSPVLQLPPSKEPPRELITSNADFFVRNHFRTPQISSDSWSLEVSGLVSTPLRLTYADLLLGTSVRRSLTMECAGNLSGGIGVGNAVWSGVLLSELLKQAGPKSGATTVVLHGADSGEGDDVPANTHFARSIPLEKAMDVSTLLAYEMNGSPLPADHGFPLRALVAGWYGMDSVKWLTRIEVTNQPFQGYFQQQYYVALRANGERRPITRMLVNSKFLRPSEGEEIRAKTYRIEGIAWAGEGKVVKVEFRAGPAEPWQPVAMASSSTPMTWTSWSYDWRVPRPGKYTLDVRATDDEGRTQPDARDSDRRDAYELNTPHRITVAARS
jgi:DMSO/TMAO reductase YedYZ molybdopterin-dependent catalytic subunit